MVTRMRTTMMMMLKTSIMMTKTLMLLQSNLLPAPGIYDLLRQCRLEMCTGQAARGPGRAGHRN